MQSLGSRLRQEREKKKIPLKQIAEETRISSRYLEALEADDLSALPGEFFYRAFVRQYSTYLGLDAEAIDRDINVVSSKPVIEEGVPSVAATQQDPQISALRETLRDKPLRPAQDDGMSKAWVAFVVLVIAGCGAYFAWKNFSPALEPVPTQASLPAGSAAEQPKAGEATNSAPAAKETEAPPPVSTSPVASPTPNVVPPNTSASAAPPAAVPATGQFSLTLVAKEMTWVRITADGARVYGGTIDAGQQRTINATAAELIVGNAGTLEVIYNGKPLQYGGKGEVKTLLFNTDGWKYKPKPLPTETPAAPSSTGDAGLGS